MSISKFQEKYLAKGCGTFIAVGCAAVMGGLVFSYFGKGAMYGSNGNPDQAGQMPIATVAGEPVPLDLAEKDAGAAISRLSQDPNIDASSIPPVQMTAAYASGIDMALDQAGMKTIAKKMGIAFNDADIQAGFAAEASQLFQQRKDQMHMTGMSDKQLDDMMKQFQGKSLTDQINEELAPVQAAAKDSSKRASVVDLLIEPILLSAISAKTQVTDEAVKASYDQDSFKTIELRPKPAPTPNVDARAAEVEKFLKSGGSFEAAMDKFSDQTPLPKKKLSQSPPQDVPMSVITANPELAPLKSLKVGQVSDPIKNQGAIVLFKLTAVKNTAPKDFAQNITLYRHQYRDSVATGELKSELKQLVSTKTEWKSEGFKLLHDVASLDADASKAQALFDAAHKVATTGAAYEKRAASLAEYIAFDAIWNAPGADQTKLRPMRIEVLSSYLDSSENFGVRMDLARLYAADKNGDALASCLLQAAGSNNSFDHFGQNKFSDIAAALTTDKAMLTAAQVQAVESAQDNWKKQMAEKDAADKVAAAEAAKEQAKERAEQAKAMAEQKAAAAKQKTTPPVKIVPSTGSMAVPGGAPQLPSFPSGSSHLPGGVPITTGGGNP